jgi:hypothetical protein
VDEEEINNMAIELPKTSTFAALIRQAGVVEDDKEIEVLRSQLFDYTERVATVIERLETEDSDEEMRRDPEAVLFELLRTQSTVGGLLGMCASLERRVKYLAYKALTDQNRTPDAKEKKMNLTQGDREFYARGSVADLEGLNDTLETYARNIESRIFVMRNSVRARY